MKWYIGQRVLMCPKDHKPVETVITGLKDRVCKCEGCLIETPAAEDVHLLEWRCNQCDSRGVDYIGRYRHESIFRPLEENFAEEVLEKALKEGKEEWNTHTKDLSNSSSR